jgi:predicted small lipoprotein YifL
MVARDWREPTVIRSSDRLPIRLAAVAMLIAAFGLAACGRKGALEPPPSAQLAEPQPAASEARRSPADVLVGTPGAREAPQQTTQQASAPKKHFFLDWLLD